MHSHFSLRVTHLDKIRVIISVSKKISKKAVVRNTVKRRVRAVMRKITKEIKSGSYLIISKPGSEIIKGAELESELKALFSGYKL